MDVEGILMDVEGIDGRGGGGRELRGGGGEY